MEAKRRKLSVIVPVLNEEACLPRLFEELTAVLPPLACDYEVLLIDNASTDRTQQLCEEFCSRDRRWKYLRFSRNFTAEISLAAGFHYATGDAAITIYSDLQDPPDKIPEFVVKWFEGYDIVYGVQTRRPGDASWRNACVKIAYRLIRWLSDYDLPVDAGDFRLITRRVRDALVRMEERNRYSRGLIHWIGFKQCAIPYERRPRFAGRSKGPFWETVGYLLTAITSFSTKPLRLFTLLGGVALATASLLTAIYVAGWMFGAPIPGLTSTLVLLLANLGLMSLGFGVLGEYIGRIYTETKRRPLWILDKTVNLDSPPARE